MIGRPLTLTPSPGRPSPLLIGILLLTFLGCQPQTSPKPATELPLTGQTVEIVAPADLALRELWEPLLQEWRAQTGGAIAWSEYERDQPPWQATGSSAPSAGGGSLVVLSLSDLADADAAGLLSPVPSALADQADGKEIFAGLKDAALSRQKRLVAVPVSAPVLLCYYRKDLLEAAGLQPPQTWDDYAALVEKLPDWAPGLSALEPCGPEFRSSLFLARSAAFAKHPQNYSVWFDIQTGLALFDSPALERSLDTARQSWRRMPAEIWNLTPADCRRSLLTGKAALILSWEPSAAYPRTSAPPADDAPSTDPLPIAVIPLPGTRSVYQSAAKRWENPGTDQPYQPGFVGFTGLVLGVRAEHDRAGAWNLLQQLTTRLDQAFAERARSICRETEAASGLAETGEFSAETASQLADATAETLRRKNVACDLAIPNASAVRNILTAELAAANDESRSTQQILAAIQERVAAATQDRRAALRDAYRRSVGLQPTK